MISHPHDWISITGAKLGLHLCLSQKLKKGREGGEGKGERQRGIEEDPVRCACARLPFSPWASTVNGVFFSSSQWWFLFGAIVHTSPYLHRQAQWMGYYSPPIEKNSRPSCSRAPRVLSACEHDERDLLLLLLRIIPVCCSRARLLFYLRAIMKNRVFFSSSREEFPFIVLVWPYWSLCVWAWWMGYSSPPLCLSPFFSHPPLPFNFAIRTPNDLTPIWLDFCNWAKKLASSLSIRLEKLNCVCIYLPD